MATRADILSWVEYAATGVELLAVAIIVVAILSATLSYLSKIGTSRRQTYLRQLPVSSRARASLGTGNSGSGRHYPHRCAGADLDQRARPWAARVDSHILELGADPGNRGAMTVAVVPRCTRAGHKS